MSVRVQLLEAETVQHIFSNNYQLCNEISESVLQHFIHCLATHGRHVHYLNFLHTIIKAEGKYVKKCQDMIMTEVRTWGGGQRDARQPSFKACWPSVRGVTPRLFPADQLRRRRRGLLQRQDLLQCHAGADGGEQGRRRGKQPTQVGTHW